MRFLRNAPKHWVVPSALAATLVAALFISPALGGPGVITGKKVVRTIEKKTSVTHLKSPARKSVGSATTTLASLQLTTGSYLVSSTFDISGNGLACSLRIVGVSQDDTIISHTPGVHRTTAALETAGEVKGTAQADVICSGGAPSEVNGLEITVIKVPKLRILTG